MNKEKRSKKEKLQIKSKNMRCKFISGLSNKGVNFF